VRLASAAAGIRYPNRQDLVLLELDPASHCAAVFTRNAFCAAPVTLARAHLATHSPRFLLVNSGNANAGTGTRGLDDARACCARLAELAGCEAEQVLPFSTGVIGEFLPVERFRAALPEALARLRADGWRPAAEAIRTTDTVAKGTTRRFDVRGIPVTITGIAKGAGMIRPDMATMLAFLATDAPVEQPVLQGLLAAAVAETFNRITVDGDTSTNDACVLIATGAAALPPIDRSDAEVYRMLAEQVHAVCLDLAQAIVRDGEGATKFITVRVSGAASEAECQTVAYTIAHSPLVKTACFASDPNWGRILAAVGRSGAAGLDIGQVAIHLDQTCVVRGGARSPDYREEQGRAVMGQEEFTIHVDLGRGTNATTLWTTDLSFDYVRINAEYRT
jgi:glutamate N-acetyltransferase/amino-acid N-acetyltransferase